MSDRIYYAIGDVHGEEDKLARLHDAIREDARRLGVAPFIVHLGDLIDRGPDSRGVIARIMALQEQSVTLRGNHEELMLNAYRNLEPTGMYWWAENGGVETILSYMTANGDADDWREAIDAAHIDWLAGLPVIWRDEARGLVFVHAGIDPRTFPRCSDEVRMWTRARAFYDSPRWPERDELRDILVVHGHTPTDGFAPDVQPRRINVDTGACFGGPLTCAVLAPAEAPRFLTSA